MKTLAKSARGVLLRPHRDNEHRGYHAVQGIGRSTRIATWTGGNEHTWTRIPGTSIEVRALANKPLALRYRPSGRRSREHGR